MAKFSLGNLLSPFSKIDSVISIDNDFESVRFFSHDSTQKNSISLITDYYKSKAFEDDFYEMLHNVVSIRFGAKNKNGRAVLVLPDSIFFTDTIKIPFIQRKALVPSLNLALGTVYNNHEQLKFSYSLLSKNKQNATFNVVGARKEILSKVVSAVSSAVNVAGVTFAANSTVNSAIYFNPKLKNSNFIVLDIKENYSRFCIAIGGRTVGFYSVPFGLNALSDCVVKPEITLFDHTTADLAVLNAKEKAKRKHLTTIDDELDEQDLTEQADELDEQDDSDDDNQRPNALYKRLNRKLPKFMQRPEPTTSEQFVFENFRPFLKWSLELVRNNSELLAFGMPETVFVNLPEKFHFLFPMLNENASEHKINFAPLLEPNDMPEVQNNLELCGALFIKKLNKSNNF